MVYQHHPPKHWNAYRPTYSSSHAQNGSPTHLPSPSNTAAPTNSNPNTIPLAARHRPSPSLHDNQDDNHENTPSLWPPSLDALMNRTSRAYDLVINYAHDSHGGQRWSPAAIALVKETGKHLHADMRVLRHWRREVGRLEDEDWVTIREDAEKVRGLCEVVLGVIAGTERRVELEMRGRGDGDVDGRLGVKMLDVDGMFERVDADDVWNGDVDGAGARRGRRRGSGRRRGHDGDSYRLGRTGRADRLGNHVLHD